MQYSEIMQETMDIDWYAVDIDGVVLHIASAGGKLPDTIALNQEDNQKVAMFVRQLPAKTSVRINPKLNGIKTFPTAEKREQYLADFVSIAERGVYSFDKSILGNFDNENYHLVAIPNDIITVKDLPPNIGEIVNRTRINKRVKETDQFSISEFGK